MSPKSRRPLKGKNLRGRRKMPPTNEAAVPKFQGLQKGRGVYRTKSDAASKNEVTSRTGTPPVI